MKPYEYLMIKAYHDLLSILTIIQLSHTFK